MSAGKLYTVQNVKMAGGRMLYDILSPGNPNYSATRSSDPRESAAEETSLGTSPPLPTVGTYGTTSGNIRLHIGGRACHRRNAFRDPGQAYDAQMLDASLSQRLMNYRHHSARLRPDVASA